MNRKILKIIFSIFSTFCLVTSIYAIIKCSKNLREIFQDELLYSIDNTHFVKFEIYQIVFFAFCCLSNILLFLIINFKDLQFLTSSLIKSIKEHRASTAEQRKAKKQAKLQAEIAEKQAELDEMKKNGE